MLCVSCITGGCGRFGWPRASRQERRQEEDAPRPATGEFLSRAAAYNLWRGGLTTSAPAIHLPPVPTPPAEGAAGSSSRNRGLSLDAESCSRRLYSSGEGLDYTPSGREAETYQYYCPLCMNYFKGIFESNCCRHLVCYGCLLNYVAGKYGVTAEDLPYLEVPFLFPLPCPHCNSLAFEPQPASKHSVVRSYKDEQDVGSSSSSIMSQQWLHTNGLSPVRPGDSFEKLQRKMLRYDSGSMSQQPPDLPGTPADSTVTELTEDLALDDDVAPPPPPADEEAPVAGTERLMDATVRRSTDGSPGGRARQAEEEEGELQVVEVGSPTAAML